MGDFRRKVGIKNVGETALGLIGIICETRDDLIWIHCKTDVGDHTWLIRQVIANVAEASPSCRRLICEILQSRGGPRCLHAAWNRSGPPRQISISCDKSATRHECTRFWSWIPTNRVFWHIVTSSSPLSLKWHLMALSKVPTGKFYKEILCH